MENEEKSELPPTDDDIAVAELPRETQADATRRWRREGIAEQVAVFRDNAREEYTKAHPGSKRRDAHEFAWTAALSSFPPSGVEPATVSPESTPESSQDAPGRDAGQVKGLGDIPDAWPQPMADNASLQSELSWVQANRLRVVEEGSSGAIRIHLSRASTPAPSMAALGWLETSVRSYAKYVDIVSRSLAQQVDEQEHVRRERMAISEIRALLQEMKDAGKDKE